MESELISGLPNDIARECLNRIPYTHFHTVASVSKQWQRELHSPSFPSLRRSNGHARSLVAFVQAAEPSASYANYRLTLFDPLSDTWHPLPRIPGRSCGLPLFCRVAAVGAKLLVLGGWDPVTWAVQDSVHVYDLLTRTWRDGARMPGPPRSFFACAAHEGSGVVVVAGGHDGEKNALRSAAAYDVEGDGWVPLPDMSAERDECGGVVLGDGKFYAVGGYRTEAQGRFSASAEAFDLGSWKWDPPVEEGLAVEHATCHVASTDRGSVYACDRGGHVGVADWAARSWTRLAALPEEMKTASQMVALERNRLLVTGSRKNGGTQVCYLLEEVEEGKKKVLSWRKIDAPSEYSGYVQAACCLLI